MMSLSLCKFRLGSVRFGLAVAFCACGWTLQAEEEKVAPAEVSGTIIIDADPASTNAPAIQGRTYWIGLSCHPQDDATGKGLAVDLIVPESPAAQAGLLEKDLILSVGDQPLERVAQLAAAIEAAAETGLKLQIQRNGKPQAVEVKPAKREVSTQKSITLTIEGQEPGNAVQQFQQQHEEIEAKIRLQGQLQNLREAHRRTTRTVVRQPGTSSVTLRGTVAASSALPADMEVTIQKRGNTPARIMVEQGEKLWKTTENELEMLPADARPYVARILGKPLFATTVSEIQTPAAWPAAQVQFQTVTSPAAPGSPQGTAVLQSVPGTGTIEIQIGEDNNLLKGAPPLQIRKRGEQGAAKRLEKRDEDRSKKLEEQIQRMERQVDELRKALRDK